MKDLFVTYQAAKLMSEIGFDENCIGYYDNQKRFDLSDPISNSTYQSYSSCKGYYSAPTLEQAINWLMDNHKIFILPHITFDDNNGHWYYYSINYRKNVKNNNITDGSFNRNQALETAILEALNHIK